MTRIFIVGLLVGIVSMFPSAAVAHETQTSGSLSVLLHVEPNHTPVVRESAHLFFTFENDALEIDVNKCQCSLSVSANEKNLYSKSLPNAEATTTKTSVVFNYQFPERNVYLVTLAGTSTDHSFDPFSFTYSVRVDTERSAFDYWSTRILGSHAHHAGHLLLFGGAILIGIILTIRDSLNKKRYNRS